MFYSIWLCFENIVYLVIGPGDSVTALMEDRIWLWNDPIHDDDFFMPPVGAVFGMVCVVSSFILMTTCPVFGMELSSNLVHAKSKDDWSVAILSGFTVISSHTYLNQEGIYAHINYYWHLWIIVCVRVGLYYLNITQMSFRNWIFHFDSFLVNWLQ